MGVGHFLLFPAKYFSTWWGIFHFWHATKTNPHLYPGVGGVGVYFDWCIRVCLFCSAEDVEECIQVVMYNKAVCL